MANRYFVLSLNHEIALYSFLAKAIAHYWTESELDKLSGFLINKGDLLIAGKPNSDK